MNLKSFVGATFGAIALAAAAIAAPATAGAAEALPAQVARQLDDQAVGFTATAAHERRMEIIRNTNRQRYGRGSYGRGGYGRGPGYGYRRGYGGPRPGYRRGYGY